MTVEQAKTIMTEARAVCRHHRWNMTGMLLEYRRHVSHEDATQARQIGRDIDRAGNTREVLEADRVLRGCARQSGYGEILDLLAKWADEDGYTPAETGLTATERYASAEE